MRLLCAFLIALAFPIRAAPVYPVKKSANGRFLVDQNNAPFLMIGDSPQALIVNISETDAGAFFANRATYGFNTVWINLLCATYTGGRADAGTIDGVLPFLGKINSTASYDLTRTNEAYFAHVDRILELAAAHGIQVMLDPAETGSFLSVLRDNGTNRCRAYGQFLGQRYKDFPNIIWMSGNDFQSWRTSGDDAVARAVALGIKDNDTHHLHTAELDYLVSSSLDDTNWNSILGLNATYTYFPTYARLLEDYSRPNFLPVFMVEANYEFESLQGPVTTAPILRKQEYWTMTSGACGQMYGNGYTWPFNSGWQDHLDTPGAIQMSHLKSFFEARTWYDLVPDNDHSVVTSGYGAFSSAGHVADNDYLTAARTADGSLVVVYTPILRQFAVDMSKLAAPAVTRWLDPSAGTFIPIAGSPFTNSGTRNFTPPSNNSDGDGGWVLALEINPPPDPPPPPRSPPVPAFVQQSYATAQMSQTQVSASYPNVQAAGNANLVAIGWNDETSSINALGDSSGNFYLPAISTFRGNGMSQAIYYATNIVAGSNTVTAAFDQPAVFVDLRVTEYSGLSPTNLLDGGASSNGIGTGAGSGVVTTTATNDLLFAAGMTATTFITAGSGFNRRVITVPDADIVADKVMTTAGVAGATATLSSGAWLMQLAAFRAAIPKPSGPVLQIFLTGTNAAVLHWPWPSIGFVLRENSDLDATRWKDVTNTVNRIGSENQVVILPSDGSRFFRLAFP